MNKELLETWDDPIVREVREAREAFAKRFNYDVGAIFDRLKKMQKEGEEQGRVYVQLPPKRIERRVTGTNN